jgi:hypothetical protein
VTTGDLGGRLALLERQIGSRKADANRIDLAEKLIAQHGLNISRYRHEVASKWAAIDRRIGKYNIFIGSHSYKAQNNK